MLKAAEQRRREEGSVSVEDESAVSATLTGLMIAKRGKECVSTFMLM